MHDWWIALVAAAFGKIGHVPNATIAYRQHSNNSIGAKKYSLIIGIRRALRQRGLSPHHNIRTRRPVQAALFLERYQNKLAIKQVKMLEAYQHYCKGTPWRKLRVMIKHKFYKKGLLRNFYELMVKT